MLTDPKLENLFADMYHETRASVMDREAHLFDRMASARKDTLVLFGAGPLGQATLSGLRKIGIHPLCFCDNNASLWGSSIDGLEVLSVAAAVERYKDVGCFVVTVYNGSSPRRQLRDLGCQCVMNFAVLYWKYADQFIPSSCMGLAHPMWDDEDNIRLGYSVLADEHSRTLFREQLQWRLNLDSDRMLPPSPVSETYFPSDIIMPIPDEVLVDCGAFDGDSIKAFLSCRNNQVARIYALEPDRKNRVKLEQYKESLPRDLAARISILPFAVGKQSGYVDFESGNLVRSRISLAAKGEATECRTLDEICDGAGTTYIKMDIEGSEPEAIEGATQVLNRNLPVLAACVYHRWEHLWQIPALIRSITSHHRIFLRRYAEDCWELVCYAVPTHRLID